MSKAYYLINLKNVQKQINKWKLNFKNINIRYAVKSNNDIRIIDNLIQNKCGFDCASKNEIQFVLSRNRYNINTLKRNIIFANPVKSLEHIKYAIDNEIYNTTFDCLSELEKIKFIDKKCQMNLFMRIHVDDSYSICKLNKKFGIIDNHIDDCVKYINNNNMKLQGIAFHVGSGCNNLNSYIDALNKTKSIMEKYNLIDKIKTIDIGGGFLANDYGSYKFSEVARKINNFINDNFKNIKFIAEPGRFISENSTILHTNIIGVKKYNNTMVYHIDESTYMGFNCINNDHQTDFIISVIDNNENYIVIKNKLMLHDIDVYETQLNGCTCDSIDIIKLKIKLPELKMGYKLVFHNFGAYTFSAGSNFNGMEFPSKVYLY